MQDEENKSYYRYTGKSRLDKAVHTMEGLLKGIAADGEISPVEVQVLKGWMLDHYEFAHKHPFCEIIPVLLEALRDLNISDEERDDLLWLCVQLTTDNTFFDLVTADMQRLQGMMAGISFDGVINTEELSTLREWMDAHGHLRQCWPYDELEALILSVLKDGKIDKKEHEELMAFFADFSRTTGHCSVALQDAGASTVNGICAVRPEVKFPERSFCFTGKSERMTRAKCAEIVQNLGGTFSANVTLGIHYLVIGAEGNPCWTYSCYGRKVEQAVTYRKQGRPLLLIHESDFWVAVQDQEAGPR